MVNLNTFNYAYWLRDVIEDEQIAPDYVPTASMLADMLTKALPVSTVAELLLLVGLE